MLGQAPSHNQLGRQSADKFQFQLFLRKVVIVFFVYTGFSVIAIRHIHPSNIHVPSTFEFGRIITVLVFVDVDGYPSQTSHQAKDASAVKICSGAFTARRSQSYRSANNFIAFLQQHFFQFLRVPNFSSHFRHFPLFRFSDHYPPSLPAGT